ncbi:DUF4351 domain-containing protein [Paenalcaligenes faecalis]|uniref:DUF4351 domain-containing protein n=1 Tax=Paenalcaligenes faecalis TaxID=2980099 RepID=UPI0022B991EC|nr:DUF4351 domain-containing protein [Paenalcaligenes faecalis]
MLEHSEDYTQAQQLLRQLDQQSAQYRELRGAILSWLRHVYFPRVAPDTSTHHTISFSEVHEMIELDPRRWGYKERMEGWQEGLEEGREKGRGEGLEEGLKRAQITILLRLLESKFGPLSSDLQQRIKSASQEQREIWTLQLLKAESLDELFH